MKKTWVRKTLSVGIMTAGALLFGPAAAQAGGHNSAPSAQGGITQVSSSNLGALNGTQFAAPITMPVNMNGNAIALGGISSASGSGVNRVAEGTHARRSGNDITQQSAGNVGFLNGTQIAVPITMPINQNGNADSLFGVSSARGAGANHVQEGTRVAPGGWNDGINQTTGGNVGFLNGTQIAVPITIPINQCGNATSFFGVSSARGVCANSIGDGKLEGRRRAGNQVGGWDNGISQSSFGNIGFLNGGQYAAPVIAPINACGNSLGSLLGTAQSSALCVNRIGDAGDDVVWVHGQGHGHGHGHGQGHGHQAGDVQGDDAYNGDDCDKSCDDDNTGDVRGDHGYNNGGGEAPAVNDDKGDVNDDNTGGAKGDKGYGDTKGSTKGDTKGSTKGDKGGKGYGDVSPDKYGDKTGGRKSVESAGVGNLTGSLGGLDLLSTLR